MATKKEKREAGERAAREAEVERERRRAELIAQGAARRRRRAVALEAERRSEVARKAAARIRRATTPPEGPQSA